MTTLRQSIAGRIATLEAELADEKARLASIPESFAQILDHDVDVVREFIRGLVPHLFGRPPAPAAVETKVYPDGTTATGTAPLPAMSPSLAPPEPAAAQ